jgi:hypothetical protein
MGGNGFPKYESVWLRGCCLLVEPRFHRYDERDRCLSYSQSARIWFIDRDGQIKLTYVPQVDETASTKRAGLSDGAGVAPKSFNEDTGARLWDTNTRKSLDVFPSDSNNRMVHLGFSREREMLVAPGIRGTVVSNVTIGAGHVLEGPPADIFKFALTTDGK